MRTIILIAMVTGASAAFALDANYSPFSAAEMIRISATQVSSVTGTNVVATFVKTGDDTAEFRIAVGGSNTCVLAVDVWLEHTRTVVVDLDGNGLEDVAKEAYYGTQGLLLGCDLMLFSQCSPGRFSLVKVPSERFTPDDVCDLDGDGRKEILTCILVGCEGHNYWVYRCWSMAGAKLVCVDARHGFPRAVWFTNKPNHRLVARDLLSKIMANYPSIVVEGRELPNQLPETGH